MPAHQCGRNVVYSTRLGKVSSSSRTPALVFLQTEELSAREHRTAEAKGTTNAECIEVGMLP
jgi:hypothetical protein